MILYPSEVRQWVATEEKRHNHRENCKISENIPDQENYVTTKKWLTVSIMQQFNKYIF